MFKKDTKMIKYNFTLLLPIILYSNECLSCHKNYTAKKHFSNHYTMKNAINITRKTWGIKDSNVTLQTLPKAKKIIKSKEDLVDDFLRRKCLSCHLTSKNINPTSNSCLACHNTHKNKLDSIKAKPTMNKCTKCHKNEYIGGEYKGLFPHDYDKAYRSPITPKGYYPNKSAGIDYHHLALDVHFKKGLTCISCHNGKNFEEKVDCKSCHKNLSKENHKNFHKNLSCNVCHSSWNISSYELNVLRDDTANYKQWKRLKVQEDIYLEQFLTKAIKLEKKGILIKPKMPDYLTNRLKNGIWYSGWKYRRWENNFLVYDKNNKVKIAKPMFQYRISYKNKNGTVILDDIHKNIDGSKIEAFIPKAPHTITKKAKSCEMCHENKIMLDNNLIHKDILKGKVIKGRVFTKKELQKLYSPKYKLERAKILFK